MVILNLAGAEIINLEQKIRIAEARKKKISDYIKNLEKLYYNHYITFDEFTERQNQPIGNRSLREWIDYYDKYISYCQGEINLRKRKKKIKKFLLYLLPLMIVLALPLAFIFTQSAFSEFITQKFGSADLEKKELGLEIKKDLKDTPIKKLPRTLPTKKPDLLEKPIPSSQKNIPIYVSGPNQVLDAVDRVDKDKKRIVLGESVHWVRRVTLDGTGPINIELPIESRKISVKKIKDIPVTIDSVITGEVIASDSNKNSILAFLKKAISFLTGLAIGDPLFLEETSSDIGDIAGIYEISYETPAPPVIESEITLPPITENETPAPPLPKKEENISEPIRIKDPSREGINVKIEGTPGIYEISYETPAPYVIEEENINTKTVKIIGPESIHYKDVLAFTNIPEHLNVRIPSMIKIYWVEEDTYVPLEKIQDTNGNGIFDYIEWNIPHLSNQTFNIIIIIKAEHLDQNKIFISDIYDYVRTLDNNWSETINENEYVRITFEKNLNSSNDITIFPRTVSGSPRIEIYEVNQTQKIAEFTSISDNQYNKVFLTNLQGLQDTFDLKILDGKIEIDHMVDPPVQNIWQAIFLSNFNNPSSWSLGHVPVAGEDVIVRATFFSGDMNIPQNTMPQNLNSFVVENSYTGTITFNSLFAVGNWGSNTGTQEWNVTNGITFSNGVMRVYGDYPNNLTSEGHGQIWRSLNSNIIVENAATLYGIDLGFPYGVGPGYISGTGGSHGGIGGGGGADPYGSAVSPTSLGSGTSSVGSEGGSAIKLEALNGNIVVNGTIDMSGSDGSNRRGSGGSIWLIANNIFGSGSLQARGGDSQDGGGGGGRIRLGYLSNLDYTGEIDVSEGNASLGGSWLWGRAGTLTFTNNTWPNNWILNGNIGLLGGDYGEGPVLNVLGDFYTNDFNVVVYGDCFANSGVPKVFVCYNQTPEGRGVWINASGNIGISSGTFIDGLDLGFPAKMGPGYKAAKGGSHGGRGGDGGANPYGSAVSPTSLGSGSASIGSEGGSAIKLEASQGNLTVDGTIDMRASSGSNQRGSGGSIWLIANNIFGSGSLQARGGDSQDGGGGGGRISLIGSTAVDFGGSIDNIGGIASLAPTLTGSGGTVYFSATESILDSSNIAATGRGGGSINFTDTFLNLSGVYNATGTNQNGKIYLEYLDCDSILGGTFDPEPDSNIGCVSSAFPNITFVPPTPANDTTQVQTNVEINVSINETSLSEVKFNWNKTNYTIFNDSLALMMNFDNISSLGENDTKVVDVSNRKNNGTVFGGNATTPNGRYGKAMQFDGVNDYVSLSSSTPGMRDFTIAFWVKTSEAAVCSPVIWDNCPHLIGISTAGPNSNDFGIVTNNGNIGFWHGLDSSGDKNYTSNVKINDGSWHFVVVTNNGSVLTLYESANKISTLPSDGSALFNTYFMFGAQHRYWAGEGTMSYPHQGFIDELSIWNRSLSASEVQQLYFTNLNKYDTDKWLLYVNQRQDSTNGLPNGKYTYQAFASNIGGIPNQTEERTITINGSYITSCQNLDTAGETYTLVNDITGISGTCFNIIADNITLDGNGYIIDGDDSGPDYGITANARNNLTIKNFANITDFRRGIYLINTNNSLIKDNTANSNSGDGIYALSSSNNTLMGNIFNSNTNRGILIDSTSNNKITSNTASNNTYGILTSTSSDTSVTNNTANSNTNDGISISNSNNNTILNNTISNNTNYGISISNSNNNTILNNTASSNTYGISIYLASSNNTVLDNTISNNTNDGIAIIDSNNNTISNNTASSNIYKGIYLLNSTNNKITNNTASSNNRGIFLEINSNNNTIENNNASSNTYGISLEVNSNNNTIENNNASSNTYVGIYLASTANSLIKNNNASSNNYGIFLEANSNNNTISNNTASSNTYVGIYLLNSANNTIENNNASSNNYGIFLEANSNNNTIKNNNASFNSDSGIILFNSLNNNTIKNNNASSNSNIGIYLYNSSNNTIKNNNANSNTLYGIYLSSSPENKITNNNASFNSDSGIAIYISSDTSVKSNTANSNNIYGIAISASNNNTISNNTASSNTYGIYLEIGTGNSKLSSNKIKNNSQSILDETGDLYTNYLIYNNSFGEIKWTNSTNGGFLKNLTFTGDIGLDINLNISNNSAYLNSSAFNSGFINSSANVTLYGIDSFNFTNPIILKNGVECTDCYNFTLLNASTVIFNVSSWSNYTIGETASLTISFVQPTPPNNTFQSQTNVEINVSINGTSLSEVKFNWNKTNYTIFNDSLALMMNFDNISSLGENDTKVVDVSNANNNGIVFGGNQTTPNGRYGKAMQFDGVNDYVDISGFNDASDEMTLSMWVYPKGSVGAWRGLLGSQGWATGYLHAQINPGNNLEFAINSNPWHVSSFTFDATKLNQWIHIAVTFKKDNSLKYYINGEFDSETTSGLNTSLVWNIPRIGNTYDNIRYFNGIIDEVRIWNRSLSASEVQQLYFTNLNKYDTDKWTLYINQSKNSTSGLPEGEYTYQAFASNMMGNQNQTEERKITIDFAPLISFISPTPANASLQLEDSIFVNVSSLGQQGNISTFIDFDNSLISWWRMDDLNATGGIVDYMGRNNGAAVGGASQVDNGYFGKGFDFDGVNDHIDLGIIDIYGSEMTMSAWINMNTLSSLGARIISKSDNPAGGHHWWMLDAISDRLRFRLKTSPGGTPIETALQSQSGVVSTNEWIHVIARYNGTAMSLFKDGIEIASVSKTGPITINQTIPLWIGDNPVVAGRPFNGTIDDVMIFNRSLSPKEIQALYANQSSTYLGVNFTNLSFGNHFFKAYSQDILGDVGTTQERVVTRIQQNFAPTIPYVQEIPAQSPVESGKRSITFNFTATDQNGASNLNSSSAQADFTNIFTAGFRSSTSCVQVSLSGNNSNYTCTVDFWYFDPSGPWIVNVTIRDNFGEVAENASTFFTYNLLTSMALSPSAITWPPLDLSNIDIGSNNDPVLINNTGNDIELKINVTGYDLQGETIPTEYIYANNFTVENSSQGCTGNTMSNATPITITSAILQAGNNSLSLNNEASGQEELFFCLKEIPQGISKQSYSSAAYGPWTITILAFFIIPRLTGKRKKKEITNLKLFDSIEPIIEGYRKEEGIGRLEALEKVIASLRKGSKNKLLTAIDLIIREIEKENNLSRDESIRSLLTRVAPKFKISKKVIYRLKEVKKTKIPVAIFSTKLGNLEAIVKYLKENLELSFSEIARELNRDQRTIWTAYKKSSEKLSEDIEVEDKGIYIGLENLTQKNKTILESLIITLKEKKLKYNQIAKTLNRDQRNIWTTYNRAIKK